MTIDSKFLNSPERRYLQKIPSTENTEFFHSFVQKTDPKGVDRKHVVWRTSGLYDGTLLLDDLRQMLTVHSDADGSCIDAVWVRKAEKKTHSRSDKLKTMARMILPGVMDIHVGNPRNGYSKKNKRTNNVGHELFTWIDLKCAGKVTHGCKMKGAFGFSKEALQSFNEKDPHTLIAFQICIGSDCCHIVDGPPIGQLRGSERRMVRERYSSKDPTLSCDVQPRNILKDQLDGMDDCKINSQNYGGVVSSNNVAYNIKREMKKDLESYYELKSGSDQKNVSIADRRICAIDIAERRRLKDTSTDYPGIMRLNNMESWARMRGNKLRTSTCYQLGLFSKTAVVLFSECCKSGRAECHYDATKYPGYVPIELEDKEILQVNLLSINSDVLITSGNKNSLRLHLANKNIAYYFSNRNAEADHYLFLSKLVEAQISIYGRSYPPLVFTTDNSNQLPSAALRIWNNGVYVLNLIQYNNILLVVLLGIESDIRNDAKCVSELTDEVSSLIPDNYVETTISSPARKRKAPKQMNKSTRTKKRKHEGMKRSKQVSNSRKLPSFDDSVLKILDSSLPNGYRVINISSDGSTNNSQLCHHYRVGLQIIQTHVSTIAQKCQTHVNRSSTSYIMSNERSANIRSHKIKCKMIFRELFFNGTKTWTVSRTIFQMALTIYIFTIRSTPFRMPLNSNQAKQHTNSNQLAKMFSKLLAFASTAISDLNKTFANMESRKQKCIDWAHSDTSKHNYVAKQLVKDLVEKMRSSKLRLFTSYVRDFDGSMATVSTTIIYGFGKKITSDGAVLDKAPLLVGRLLQSIPFKTAACIKLCNPLFSTEIGDYLINTWSGMMPMWSGELVRCARIGADATVDDNNQHSEARIRTLKSCSKFNSHKHSVATLLHYMWDLDKKENRLFASSVRRVQTTKKNINNLPSFDIGKSRELLEVEEECRKDVVWKRSGIDLESLRSALQYCFSEKKVPFKFRQHEILEKHAKLFKKKNPTRFKNENFNCNTIYSDWIRNASVTESNLSRFSILVIKDYVESYQNDKQFIDASMEIGKQKPPHLEKTKDGDARKTSVDSTISGNKLNAARARKSVNKKRIGYFV